MRRRLLVAFALAFALAWAVDGAAGAPQLQQQQQQQQQQQKKIQKAQPADKKTAAEPRVPLRIYLAKGEANACGEGCSEWIAVDGTFDAQAAVRVRSFLQRHGARKLPVYFHSPGGHGGVAMTIGRELRARGITAGVAMTVPRACAAAEASDACRAARQSPQPVAAEWRPSARCSSACVYALIGARVRHVPPPARLGVHSVRVTFMLIRRWSDGRVQHFTEKQLPALQKTRVAEFNSQLRRYITEMGIAPALFEAAVKIPHEDIHYLTRDQIAAFGIDRSERETDWFVMQTPRSFYVAKWIVEARGQDRKEFRVSTILLSCSKPGQAELRFYRGLTSSEQGKAAAFTFRFGQREVVLVERGDATRSDLLETGGSYAASRNVVPIEGVEAAAAGGAIQVAETDPGNSRTPPRPFSLSSRGLADGLTALRQRCAAGPG